MSVVSHLTLKPLSLAYSALTRLRLAAYGKGLLKKTKLEIPVISVGNITTGGTGKTPLVEWLCRMLAREGRKVAILTRGYGRVNPGQRVIVSDGLNVLTNARQAGDEPQLLAENLKGIAAVICDVHRSSAGQWAIDHLGTEVFVLDDGFQHLRLARDLNILTIDASNPWGGRNLLPYGRMREPLLSISRADCVILTRTEQGSDLIALKDEIKQFTDSAIFVSRMQTALIRRIDSSEPEKIESFVQPVAAFCGVGNPHSFFEHLEREGLALANTRTFSDHHRYQQTDIDVLIQEAKKHGASALITTAKDAVKIRDFAFALTCYVLEIEIKIDQEDRLVNVIQAAVNRG